jgi:hypothetical protein
MSGREGSRKRLNPVVTYTWLWPGLVRAWLGEWPGLGQAACFALLVDGMLLSTVVWDEVLGSTATGIGWSVVALAWLIGAIAGRRRLKELLDSIGDAPQSSNATQDLFPEALNEYLQGNWLVAEEKCRELVRRRRDDVEARLMLATLLRHTERYDEARRALDDLEKFDGAGRWEMEIDCERRLLDDAVAESDADGSAGEGTEEVTEEEGIGTTEPSGSDLPTRRAA